MTDITAIHTLNSGIWFQLNRAFSTLTSKYRKYALYRDTMNELNALTGAELKDLGLSRSELRRVAYEAAYE